ncbi:MAG TPA: HEPN domain-containing protein [Gemmataceae bacterium]|nr:HEPN domain-containing protein [Gemmataceae bacterium]
MPSASWLRWQNERMPRLAEVDGQCAASLVLAPPLPNLVDENLRGYVLLLSAHFQGFCRDLYTESALVVASKVRPSLRLLIQAQFTAHLKLDHGNPNLQNLKADCERFGFLLNLPAVDPLNPARLTDLDHLNKWRNAAAHHATTPTGTLLSLAALRGWRNSCDGVAKSLDAIMYTELRRILKRAPWAP